MALHLVKLCVGAESIADLEGWNEWNSVYKINTTDTRIDTGTVLDFFLSFKTHISLLFFSFLVFCFAAFCSFL